MHADKVVCVHDSVNESVEDDSDVDITIVVYMRVEPVKEEDGKVMVNVKEGQLSPLFAKNNKDSVPKVPDLGDVEQPKQVRHGRISLVVRVARCSGVVIAVGDKECLDGHVRAKHDLRYIVHKLDWVRVDGRNSSLHDSAANNDKSEVGSCN